MKDIMKLFNDYAKTFDLKNPKIMEKFHHSYRVMEFAEDIGNSINLNEEDMHIVKIAALFHDIARFTQWTEYETYIDAKSFDHGDKGYDILKEKLIDKLVKDQKSKDIILASVKNHNKFEIEDNLDEKQLMVAKIIRDADKLDIMKEQGFIKENNKLKDVFLSALKNHKMITNDLVENEMGSLCRLISFIFDFNFKYTYEYTLKNQIIENKVNLLEIYGDTTLDDLMDNLINYMKGRLEC